MNRKEAQEQLQQIFDLYYRNYEHLIDQIQKSFAYMKCKINENKEAWKDLEMIFNYTELCKIYDSFQQELDLQLDTIMNGDKAEQFKNPFTLDYFIKDEWKKSGFRGGL